MAEWKAVLVGTHFDLARLAMVFSEGDPLVTESTDRDGHARFLLEAHALVGVELKQVHSAATGFVALLNGCMMARYPTFRPVRLNAQYVNSEGTTVVLGSGSIRITFEVGDVVTGDRSLLPFDPLWLVVAATDGEAADALRFLGAKIPDFVALYKVYEVIRASIGSGRQLVSRGWATTREVDAFTLSANHPAVSGDAARHGRQSGAPPKPTSPTMDRDSAEQFIRRLVELWLTEKASAGASSL
jgi:hypothetical protein